MTNTGAKASPRKVVTAQEPASTTKTWHRHQTHREQVTLLRGSLNCTAGQCASGQLSLTWFLGLNGWVPKAHTIPVQLQSPAQRPQFEKLGP